MKRKMNPRTRSARSKNSALPPEIGELLKEIEKEPIPERLLDLAVQLQEALARRRAEQEESEEEPRRARAGRA